jgi:hemoglobin
MPVKKDIETRADIEMLMSTFYTKLLADPSISYLFTDVAKIDIHAHLSILADFWETILFQKSTYQKNAMLPHMILHRKSPLHQHHFETWIGYFKATVDQLFEGDMADAAKQKAIGIAGIMQLKTAQLG